MSVLDPEEGEAVIVKEPTRDELWNHSFHGTIYSLPSFDGDTYVIEDADGDSWEMERHRFILDGEE